VLAASRGVNVEVLRHDLGAEQAPGSGFDLVHARLVLGHVYDYPAGAGDGADPVTETAQPVHIPERPVVLRQAVPPAQQRSSSGGR